MEVAKLLAIALLGFLLIQIVNGDIEEIERKSTEAPYNPLENLILNQQHGVRSVPLNRVKRQYGPYDRRRYPYPVPIVVGLGGFGGGYGYGPGFGRGFGGRAFGGRGFGGRGFGGRGIGGRGIGGRGGGGGHGGGRG